MVIPYTDYVLTIILENADLSTAKEIHVTIEQNGRDIDTTDVTATSDGQGGCTMTAAFTQVQTSRLRDNIDAFVQVNWINSQGVRPIPPVKQKINVGEQLLKRVLYVE